MLLFCSNIFNLLGSLPKWVVNKASQVLAPKVSKPTSSFTLVSVHLLFEDASVFLRGPAFKACESTIVTMETTGRSCTEDAHAALAVPKVKLVYLVLSVCCMTTDILLFTVESVA